MSEALVHLDAALHELTMEAWSCAVQLDPQDDENWQPVPALQATIANDLDRAAHPELLSVDDRRRLLFGIGEAIRQAVIEITAAKQSLEVNHGQ